MSDHLSPKQRIIFLIRRIPLFSVFFKVVYIDVFWSIPAALENDPIIDLRVHILLYALDLIAADDRFLRRLGRTD